MKTVKLVYQLKLTLRLFHLKTNIFKIILDK